MKKILYIGNNLTSKSNYNSTLTTLSNLLNLEGYTVKVASSKTNKLFRMLDMINIVFKNKNTTDYILIDTFSTVNFYYAFIISQLARVLKIKYIPILHGGNLPVRLKKSNRFSKMIFLNSYKNIAPSNYLKEAFEKEGFVVKLIPNILELESYKFKERAIIKPKILWVRAFRELYNPTLAIEVLEIVKKKFTDATLCMVGPEKDDSFKATKKLIHDKNLSDCVKLTGVLPKEIWHELSKKYDIFINTTNFDNTPVSVLEAMALGLPIVSTNVGGMPYIIEHEINGILVDPNNPKQMAQGIMNICKAKKSVLQGNARLKVESLGWNTIKKEWLDILT